MATRVSDFDSTAIFGNNGEDNTANASLVYLVVGVCIGWSSPLVPRLQQNTSHIVITADEGSWLASTVGLVAAPPSLLAGVLVDVVGRRRMMLACALPFFVTAVWQRFASSFWELLASNILSGVAIGFIVPVFPLYVVEIAQDHIRGLLVSLGPLMAGIGAFLMMIVASYAPFDGVTEFMMAGPVVFVASFWWMPESPYFLVAKHRSQEAAQALMRLRGKSSNNDVIGELEAIQRALEERTKNEISAADAFLELRRNAGARRAFFLSITYVIVLVFGGSATMGLYSTQIFQTTGSSLDASVSAIILCAVQVAFNILGVLLVDRVGRRPLVLFSFGGCAVTVAALGTYFYLMKFGNKGTVDSLFWLPLTALILYYISYDMGGNALLWVLSNELTPASVRGVSNSCVGILLSVLAFGITKLFQLVEDSFGTYVPFWFFSISCFVGVIFAWFFIPETKGRSLEDITAEMSAKAEGLPRESLTRKTSLEDISAVQ
ncbi:facilitated trehalose transporter Tret1-like [Schistocerca americana]|uniref:facilitated trehalose transporter Tret1-like n=1 Tax=Schistocerca americana TaxID=7009 RepID=UPI001F4F4AAA|nr:facilitated trehalose transporter Tret1-like [Schistocerca americana]